MNFRSRRLSVQNARGVSRLLRPVTTLATNLVVSLVCVFGLAFSPPALALKSDRNQPATLDADQFDLDFQTGVRTYRGNVIYRQGSIHLTADEIVAYFDDNGSLEKAVATGKPARFKQRPENAEEDVVGTGARIELDEIARLVTIETNAVVTQGNNTLTGRKITYNLDTEKARVQSGARQKAQPAEQKEGTKEPSKGEIEGSSTGRPRLIIKPRQ